MIRNCLAALALLIMISCATVPQAAPAELHTAARAVKAANHAGARKFLPHSMAQSERRLDQAVQLYKLNQVLEARQAAKESEALATRALHLAVDVQDWDGGDLTTYESFRHAESDLLDAKAQLARERSTQPTLPASDQAGPLSIAQPVAYFDTASTAIVNSSQPALNELINSLKLSPDLQVTLLGYADRRGDSALNAALGRQRVIAVANYLVEQGIDNKRIRIVSRGADDAAAATDDIARLQLDRRVDAQMLKRRQGSSIPNVAH